MMHAFWVVLEGDAWGLPLTVVLPDGTEAIALFSGEEEAQMFCRFRDEETIPTIRQASLDEVLSLLYYPWSARHAALDPLPGTLGARFSAPIALSRTCFARRFAVVGPGSVASADGPVYHRASWLPVTPHARGSQDL